MNPTIHAMNDTFATMANVPMPLQKAKNATVYATYALSPISVKTASVRLSSLKANLARQTLRQMSAKQGLSAYNANAQKSPKKAVIARLASRFATLE